MKKIKNWIIKKLGGFTDKELFDAQNNINKQWKTIIVNPKLLAMEQTIVKKEKSLLNKIEISMFGTTFHKRRGMSGLSRHIAP